MRLARLLLLSCLLFLAARGIASALDLPGVEGDAARYQRALQARNPAGGTPQARRQAEQRAVEAQRRNDLNAAAAAWEDRIALGGAGKDEWTALARAQLRRTPPDAAHALQAAWQAFGQADAGPDEIPSLLLMNEALRLQDRPAQAILVLEAVLERAPDDAGYRRQLAEARRAAGLLVRGVTTDAEADPPRACIVFTSAPVRRGDFVAGDWVRLDPPVATAAVTRESDRICVSGLPLGATTTVLLREGLPGEDGLRLNRAASLPVAMGHRRPRLATDTRLFILPRGQAPRVTLSSTNLSAVKLRLFRLGERMLVPFVRENRLGDQLASYSASIVEENGRKLWEGRADIPQFRQDATLRTALPVPDAFDAPGLYALLVGPGDGTPDSDAFVAQFILRTDLAPTVWRGTDGVTLQVRGYGDALPRPGVHATLLARDNDILAEVETDAAGVARFPAPLLAGEGPQSPHSVTLQRDGDLATLDLTSASFDLSDRGVEGLPHPGPLDAYAWTERGIYRPGETVNLMALLRDAAGQPADIPTQVTIRRPNGQVFLQAVPPRGGGAAVHLPFTLSASAPAGVWTIELRGDPVRPPIGRASFRVDAFVPDRMAVEVQAPGPLVPGQPLPVSVLARYLYGAPAAGLSGKATLTLTADAPPPPALTGYRVGLEGEVFAPDQQQSDLPQTDAEGRATLPLLLARAPDTTRPVQAQLQVDVDDPSGRGVRGTATIPVQPAGNLIGIKPAFGEQLDADTEAVFEVAATGRQGARTGLRARLRLVRERPDWRMVVRGGTARYETVMREEPVDQQEVQVPAATPLRYARRLPFGRYRIEVTELGGMAASSVRFRAGWVASESPDVPDKVDVSVARARYAPGEAARVHVVAPFAGRATLAVLSDRVHSLRNIDLPAGGTDVDVVADPAWGPGAYVAVHAFRPGGEGAAGRPARAIGLAWVGIDPARRTLAVALDAPERALPRAPLVLPVRTAPGAWVSVAAVDEGILRLTSFASPDPAAHLLGRRRLGLDIRDDWGRLIPPADGEATALRQGGDDGGAALPEIPQRTVSLFLAPVRAGANGIARVTLDLPDFAGAVRLMAVAWEGNRIGAAAQDMRVADPLVAEPLLPRFLAPGDETRLAVQLQNLDLPEGDVSVAVSVQGPLALGGSATLGAHLARGAQSVQQTLLRATGVGRGTIRLDVTGPGSFTVRRETAILVRPARPPVSLLAGGEIAPGAEVALQPALDRFVPGTARASVRFGGPVRYDPAALVRALEAYPLSCLEQAASRALPLALLPDGPVAGPDRAARLQQGVQLVLDRQRYDGAFGLWTAAGEDHPWLTAYAVEFLLRARDAGAAVPEAALRDALKNIEDGLEASPSSPDDYAVLAYRLHVLAMSGRVRAGAARVAFESMDRLPTPLARAQLGAALARASDRPRAEAAFAAALRAPAREYWSVDYGTALRDQAAAAVLLKESGLLADRLPGVLAALPGSDLRPDGLSTQEQAWAAAAAAVLGRDGAPARIGLDGATLGPAPVLSAVLTGPATARNLGERAVWQSVSTAGVLRDPPPAARNRMRVSRRFFTQAGDTLDLDKLAQNTVFVMLIEGQAEDGQDHTAMLIQGLPAGWELVGRLEGTPTGMPWLGELTTPDATPAADDRYAASLSLTADKPAFRLAVRLRAVTPGNFEMPGAVLADMYRPALFARQATNRVSVLPAP